MSEQIRFDSAGASIMGTIGGVGLATGVPWVLLHFGQALSQTVLTSLVIFGVVIGGLMATASAFFGVVIPSQIHGQGHPHHGRHHCRCHRPERGSEAGKESARPPPPVE